MNLQSILDIASRLVEIGLIEFKPGMGLNEIEAEYRERVQGTMQDYMDSDRTVVSFRNEMRRLGNDSYLLAAVAGWVDGGGDGPMPDSLTEYVNQQVEVQFVFINDVFAKLKELRKSGTQDEQAAYIEGRADGYTASIQGIYDYARVTAAADILLTFDGPDGSADAICQKTGGTCVKLKGQTHKASWWIEQGLIPYKGNPNFDCGAWKCRHQLFDKDGNVWANQQVSEYDPDQPRDDAGRFSSTGGSAPERQEVLQSDTTVYYAISDRAGVDLLSEATAKARSELKANLVASLSTESGVDPAEVKRVIDTWASSSNDNNPMSLATQITAAQEFNSPLSEWQKDKINLVSNGGLRPIEYDKDTAMVLRASYEKTQEAFQSAGFSPDDTVTVYRGIYNLEVDGEVDYKGNAVESWSISPKVAYEFGAGGTVLAANVKVSDIVSSCISGMGCLTEAEVIVKGTSRGIKVQAYKAGMETQKKFHEVNTKQELPKIVIDNDKNDDWIKSLQPADEVGMATVKGAGA